jgi:hypothetical protein
MTRIAKSLSPTGRFHVTTSPTRALINALASGDTQLTLLSATFASSSPTITMLKVSP